MLIKESAPTVLARRVGRSAADDGVDTSWKALLTFPVLVLFAVQFMVNVGRGGAQGNGGPYLIFAAYAFGTGPATLGALSFATGPIGVPVTISAGHIMDRFGRKRMIVPASALLGAGLGSMSAVALAGLGYYVGAFVVINLAVSLMAGSMQTLGSDIAPLPGPRQVLRIGSADRGRRLPHQSRELRHGYRAGRGLRRVRCVFRDHGWRGACGIAHGGGPTPRNASAVAAHLAVQRPV